MSVFLSIIGGLVMLAIVVAIAIYAFTIFAGSAIFLIIASVVILILFFAMKGCTSVMTSSTLLTDVPLYLGLV